MRLLLIAMSFSLLVMPAYATRYKLVDGVKKPYTQEEEVQANADEQKSMEKPLSARLNEIFESLPNEAQADLAPLKTAVKLELELGREDIAKLIIQRASVPKELDLIKLQMMNLFRRDK